MSTSTYNRNDPRFVEYYQALADIIGIFWQFHKERLIVGNMELAQAFEVNRPGVVRGIPYDPAKKAQRAFSDPKFKLDVLSDYGNAVNGTLIVSWNQFLDELGEDRRKFEFTVDTPVPDSAKKFADKEYVNPIIKKAKDLSIDLSRVRDERVKTFYDIVEAGIITNSDVAPQLRGLFGDKFKPAMALAISKIRIDNISLARKAIGLDTESEESPSYALLDSSSDGLDQDRIREFGMGRDTLGCPAGMRVSEPTREFLEQKGVKVERTMLGELISMTGLQFDHYIGEWYRKLDPLLRRMIVDSNSIRVLEGTFRQTEATRPGTRFPNTRGKERG